MSKWTELTLTRVDSGEGGRLMLTCELSTRGVEFVTEDLRIVVHRVRDAPKVWNNEDWFLSCPELRIKTKKLEAHNLENAQQEAILMVRLKLKTILKGLKNEINAAYAQRMQDETC